MNYDCCEFVLYGQKRDGERVCKRNGIVGYCGQGEKRKGNLGYEYFFSQKDEETVLLVDKWTDEQAIDDHHKSEMMKEIARLRDKYKLRLKVEKFIKE